MRQLMRLIASPYLVPGLAALVAACWVASPARAALVTYGFGGPDFPTAAVTPFLDIAPDSGPAGFRASFTSGPDAGGFTINSFPQPEPNINGTALFDPLGGSIDVLTVTTNTPIDRVELLFTILSAGTLQITTPDGGFSQPSGNIGGNFPGGTLTFAGLTPFTTFELEALDMNGNRTRFAIDDLVLNTVAPAAVPEPTSLALIGTGVVGLLGYARRRAARA